MATINIKYPFETSSKGFYVALTELTKDAIKSDLLHLILTRKGTRYYNPSFGTNLLKFIFEPNDSLSHATLTQDIKDTVKKYLPNLQINKVGVTQSKINEHVAQVEINYTVTEGVLEQDDTIIINI